MEKVKKKVSCRKEKKKAKYSVRQQENKLNIDFLWEKANIKKVLKTIKYFAVNLFGFVKWSWEVDNRHNLGEL